MFLKISQLSTQAGKKVCTRPSSTFEQYFTTARSCIRKIPYSNGRAYALKISGLLSISSSSDTATSNAATYFAMIDQSSDRIIASLSGRDAPGITAEVAAVVAKAGSSLVDIRQTVVRGRLTLVVELERGPEATDGLFLGLIAVAKSFGLSIDFDTAVAAGNQERLSSSCDDAIENDDGPPTYYVLTLLSEDGISISFLQELGERLAARMFSVEKVIRLSSKLVRCLELGFCTTRAVSAADISDLRKELYAFGMASNTDVALQAETVLRRSKRLVVMDMDSTLIQQEVIDELARYAGVYDKVQEITERAMNGELDFNQSLEQRVGLLKGTHESVFDKVIANLVYTDGAHYLCRSLKRLGYRLAVISGGFKRVTQHVRQELGLDYDYANMLETSDGKFTGRTVGPIVNAQRKADLLMTIAQTEGITLDQCVAIGDGSNDLPMLGTAGLGIAFNAKPSVQERASFRINQRSLESVLYLLGFSEDAQRQLAGREATESY